MAMTSPFLQALADLRSKGLIGALASIPQYQEQNDAQAQFGALLQAAMGRNNPGSGVKDNTPQMPAGGPTGFAPPAPAPAAAPTQAGTGQGGKPASSPQRAILDTLLNNPDLIGKLPQEYFANASNLVQLFNQTNPPAQPTELQKNVAFLGANGVQLTSDMVLNMAGAVSDKAAAIPLIEQMLQRPLTEQEQQTYWGLVANPQNSINVRVGVPDTMSPVLNFLSAQQQGARQDKISTINNAMDSLQSLNTLTTDPNAAWLFGSGLSASQLGANAVSMAKQFGLGNWDTAFGPLGGPKIQTVGEARAAISTALETAANAIMQQGGKDVSANDRKQAAKILADPESFLATPETVRGAVTFLQSKLQSMQAASTAEGQAGGVKPTASSLPPEMTAQIKTRMKAILLQQGFTDKKLPTQAQVDAAMGQAFREVIKP